MTVEVKGLSDLKQFLDALPGKLANNIMRGAMAAAAREVGVTAKQLCPVGSPAGKNKRIYGGYEGALRDSIRVSARLDPATRRVIGKLLAGGKTKRGADVYYAQMVEMTGAVQHRIIAEHGHALFFGSIFAKSLEHPGFRAKPFMRPALDQKAGAAVVAAGQYVQKRLTKQGLDAADIVVEEV